MASLGIDPQGCLDVTRKAARRFHRRFDPSQANIPRFCVAGDPARETVCWPLRRLHAALCEIEGPNDGLVSVESANAFGRPLPLWPVDHFRQMNWLPRRRARPRIVLQPIELHAEIVDHLAVPRFRRRSQCEPLRTLELRATRLLLAGSPIG